MIVFKAFGVPIPKGSMKAFMPPQGKFPIMTNDNTKTRPWMAIVKDAARQAVNSEVIPYSEAAIWIQIIFYLPRPKTLPKRIFWPTKKPDLDKLERAIFDALKDVIWTDDSQVVDSHPRKFYTNESLMPHALIAVGSMDESQQLRQFELAARDAVGQLDLRQFGMGA